MRFLTSTRDVRNGFFKFLFGFGSVFEKKVGFGSESVWFGSVKKCGSVWIL